jgi:putative sigma-54 modulation protein
MQIETTGRNFHLDDRLRAYIETKLPRIVKFVDEPIEVRITLQVEKHRHIAELHIAHRLGIVHVTEEHEGNMQEAVNLAVDKAEAQARRTRTKEVDKRRRAGRNGHHGWPVEVLEGASVESGGAPRIIESSQLAIKPMTIEEAALELPTSQFGFVVFRDAGSDRLSVLFKRPDGNYGLIAPGEA